MSFAIRPRIVSTGEPGPLARNLKSPKLIVFTSPFATAQELKRALYMVPYDSLLDFNRVSRYAHMEMERWTSRYVHRSTSTERWLRCLTATAAQSSCALVDLMVHGNSGSPEERIKPLTTNAYVNCVVLSPTLNRLKKTIGRSPSPE